MVTTAGARRRAGTVRTWGAAVAALLGLAAGMAWSAAPAAAAEPPPWERVVGGAIGNPAVVAARDLLHSDAFVRTGTSLFHQRAARETTFEQDLGGITDFDPAAAANDEGTFAFVTGIDGGVYYRLIGAADGTPGPWVGLGGISRRSPSAATDREGAVHVFVAGSDGGVWTRHQTGGGSAWSPWATLGGIATSDIAVSSGPQVFVRGVDGAVYLSSLQFGAWSNWFRFAGRIVGSPSVSPDGFLAVRGTDNQVYVPWDGGFIPTGGFITGDPTVGDWGPSGTGMWSHLIYGRGPDGAAYVQAWGRGRSTWARIESQITSELGFAAHDP